MVQTYAKKNAQYYSPKPAIITVSHMEEIQEEEPDFQRMESPKFQQEGNRKFMAIPEPKLQKIIEEQENDITQ